MVVAAVHLWGRLIGAVSLEDGQSVAAFEYDADFRSSNIQVAPLKMPLAQTIYRFPELPLNSFHGLPGLLADSLPDKFGNALIDAWLAEEGRTPESFSAVERLLYIGTRGMGALEFKPAIRAGNGKSEKIDLGALVKLASEILTHRNNLRASFSDGNKHESMREILRVGTSAGGARAKAIIAWNPTTNEVRSGQVAAGKGFDYWLLKFDGVSGNKDKDLEDPNGFCTIEYAYYLMAGAAGISMMESRLFEEGSRRHFMTKRFDRLAGGEKLHMQSLAALNHFDFNNARAHSYEQAMLTIRNLRLPYESVEEQFRRAVFNIVARNQDDHVKNIAFLMNKEGQWSLSPAFDMTYAYNPGGDWTNQHQMSLNGKRDDFTAEDFAVFASSSGLKRGRYKAIVEQVTDAVSRWPAFAKEAGVPLQLQTDIASSHKLDLK